MGMFWVLLSKQLSNMQHSITNYSVIFLAVVVIKQTDLPAHPMGMWFLIALNFLMELGGRDGYDL